MIGAAAVQLGRGGEDTYSALAVEAQRLEYERLGLLAEGEAEETEQARAAEAQAIAEREEMLARIAALTVRVAHDRKVKIVPAVDTLVTALGKVIGAAEELARLRYTVAPGTWRSGRERATLTHYISIRLRDAGLPLETPPLAERPGSRRDDRADRRERIIGPERAERTIDRGAIALGATKIDAGKTRKAEMMTMR